MLRRHLGLCIAVVIVLGMWAVSHSRSSSFDGTWVKQAGGSELANELSIRHSDNHFRISYESDGGLQTVDLQTDGLEHEWSSGNGFRQTYRAQLNGETLNVTKVTSGTLPGGGAMPPITHPEQWSLANGGRKLLVTSGADQTVFQRAPLFRSLFKGLP